MSKGAKVWIALWVVYIVWGSTYLAIELAGETMPGFFGAGVRFTIAGLLMLGFIAWRRGLGNAEAAARRAGLGGGRRPAPARGELDPLHHGAEGADRPDLADHRLDPALGAAPAPAAEERPDRLSTIGLVIGFAGIVLLVHPGSDTGPLSYLLITVAASFMWALGSFLSPRIPVPRDALVATGYEMLCGGVVLLVIGVFAYSPSELDPANWSSRSILGLVYLITFGSLLGYSAYVWLLANAPIAKVSTYAYVNPVIAIALGVIVLDETVTLRIVVGALLILAAVAVVLQRESALQAGELVRPDRDPR